MPRVDFWFDFASTYSYLTAMRIERLAQAAGVGIAWRPFLLGPIFKAQGWETSPFNLFPAKGRYMARDIERIAAARGLPFKMPEPFPQTSLLAARMALALPNEARAPFARAVFAREFGEGRSISDEEGLAPLLAQMGFDPRAVIAKSGEAAIKESLRAETAEAQGLGIFGAPSFVTTDGELFWGDDRLEQALAWAGRT